MSKINEGLLDKVRKYIIQKIDSDLDKKLDAILNNPSPRAKKVAIEVAKSLEELEKEYKKLGY
jgi:hypothetical protein